ncbi:rod shape-determining protein MreC [Paenibacillus sp. FSL E2-8871]|uniref:Cell shape-determining protein MreC n=1 Tax=Paenibacillus odorifer TaxID=189426 RepID=A0A1R0ZA54_9BACL|nr:MULTISPECIES: rod shape-determining protein MreC [Paenibacillus]MBY3623517.1 rod shape-determining protein MreC [Acinetobacter sp. CUI P1]AIQ25683.1 rod shape-determining protein MreC [Paenibacillus sp. FSL H7-0737]KAA1185360.1 rod shape-determining protein MreC [Paenibacillus sp. B2(2019)]OMD46987.1 rod shape-determining protein MreC [Paenibacillus odorifer]OME65291.1 rod shape-determining protein MreC [Paenibacillus odorifer]
MLKLFKLLSNKRLFILLITLVLFIVVMGFSLASRSSLSWPENFLRDTTGFVQKMFYKPAGYVAGLFEDIGNLKDLSKENEQLKILAAQYARDKAQYNFIQVENEQLKEQLKFTKAQEELYKYQYHIAQVVSQTTEPSNSTIVIDLGAKDGVRPNMSVISVDGLVGVISQVSNFTSTVKLMTMMDTNDPNSQPPIAATAINKEGKTFGMIESYDPKTNKLLMNKIPPGDPIAPKDVIVSSGIGGLYPRGLTIGTVESVEVGEFGLTSTAVIKPSAEFQDWKQLIVVFTEERAE